MPGIILSAIHYQNHFLDEENVLTRNEYISGSNNILSECDFTYQDLREPKT